MQVEDTQISFNQLKQDEQESDRDCSHKDSQDEGTYEYISELSYDSCSEYTSIVFDSYITQVSYVSLIDHEFHEQVVSELQNSEILNKQPIYDTYGNDLE